MALRRVGKCLISRYLRLNNYKKVLEPFERDKMDKSFKKRLFFWRGGLLGLFFLPIQMLIFYLVFLLVSFVFYVVFNFYDSDFCLFYFSIWFSGVFVLIFYSIYDSRSSHEKRVYLWSALIVPLLVFLTLLPISLYAFWKNNSFDTGLLLFSVISFLFMFSFTLTLFALYIANSKLYKKTALSEKSRSIWCFVISCLTGSVLLYILWSIFSDFVLSI